MAKKKKLQPTTKKHVKSYETGKTGSVVGSIYTYKKHKKPKRLGKTCIHFNKEKLTCRLSKTFCKDADSCTSYAVNPKEIQIVQEKKLTTEKAKNINEVGITAIVLSDNRKCTNNNHKIIDLNATLRIARPDGII